MFSQHAHPFTRLACARRFAFAQLALVTLCLSLCSRIASSQDVQVLTPGNPIERELTGGQTHAYQLNLAANQYLYLVVMQKGIDVEVVLLGPGGKELARVDSPNGDQGPEPVRFVTEVAGDYRLQINALEKTAKPGRYEVKIAELRAAAPLEKERITADTESLAGRMLLNERTPASLKKGIEKLKLARSLYQTTGDRKEEAECLFNLGIAFTILNDELTAITEYYHPALQIFREVGARREEAVILNSIGLAWMRKGEMKAAVESFQQSLPIRQELGDRNAIANLRNSLGTAYRAMGENQQAVTLLEQALEIWTATGDEDGQATARQNLAVAVAALGDLQRAIELNQQILPVFRKLKVTYMEAGTLTTLGSLYQSLGEKQQALDYFNQAAPIWRQLGDKMGEAGLLLKNGATFETDGELQQALECYTQALTLATGIKNPRGQAAALDRIASVSVALGDYPRAFEAYPQALQLRRETKDRVGEAGILRGMAKGYAASGDQAQARDHYQQALAIYREVSSPGGEAASRYGLARIERDDSHFTEARAQIEATINIVEALRARFTDQDLQSSYFATVQSYYEFYADLLMQMHQARPAEGFNGEALQVSERARARGLRDLLIEARADLRQGTDPALLDRERTLQQMLNDKAELQMKLLGSPHSEAKAAASARELEEVRGRLREVRTQIRQHSPRYAALTQPQPLTVAELQKEVLDAKTILLEYALGQERSYLWVVTPGKLTSYELPKREQIEAAARRVLELMTTRNQNHNGESLAQRQTRLAKADARYAQAALKLSRMIIRPVAAQLGRQRLLVVADGALQYVPFAALPVAGQKKKNQVATRRLRPAMVPLIAEHEIVSLPSASVLAEIRRNPARQHTPAKTVAVIADPVFEANDERITTVPIKAADQTAVTTARVDETRMLKQELGELAIKRLPWTRAEAAQILKLAGHGTGMQALDFKASRATATSDELSQYRIVHFATHGYFDTENPELSRLVLSRFDEKGQPQAGNLLAPDIFNLRLPADLVVLSGCKTALGKAVRGEGIGVLTRGFMYAGAARVVASLWSVSDQGTAELMARFYRGMLGAKPQSPSAALRAAQVAMSQDRRFRAPYYWAAFILQGEW